MRLVVQSDDFGMCHAANRGAVEGFTNGIVTQASTMVSPPWFFEAAALAREHGIPVGMHCTLTCEWDGLRWAPLTRARSLAGADGTLPRTAAEARDADDEDVIAELVAQHDRFTSTGLSPRYYDAHMGVPHPDLFAKVADRLPAPFLWSLPFASVDMLSVRGAVPEKRAWLLRYLLDLGAGLHILVSHCATDDPELDGLAKDDSPVRPWARDYRVTDLEVLTDPDVRAEVDRLGIELVDAASAVTVLP